MKLTAYTRFVAASGLTNMADGVALVAWGWLASLLSRDPVLIALVPVALRCPWFFCAIQAGIMTDRMDRKRLILMMDVVRLVVFVGVALALWRAVPLAPSPLTGVSDVSLYGMLIVAALSVGTAEVFRDNAAQTMMPAIVPHAQLERANGRLWSVELVGNGLAGPALGAFLIAWFLPVPFALNALAFGLAVVLIWPLEGAFQPKLSKQRNWRAELREGYEFLKGAPLLRALAWITGFWNLIAEMAVIGLVLHVQENLDLGAQAYGLILAAGAIGGILGGWWGTYIIAWLGPMRSAQWMLVASAPAFLAMALAPSALALGMVMALFQFSGLVWNTVSVSYRQRHIPDALLGRVNSLYRLMAWGMMPVGLLVSGVIVRVSEMVVSRDIALIMPFLVAFAGAILLGLFGWRALARNWV
jgi:hypothetical protein